jgi:hypothetical protein
MATRIDLSDKLIHFTKGDSGEDAFAVLQRIIAERRLIAGNGMIKGGYQCLCFTEAPIRAITEAFVKRVQFERYSAFGIMFEKSWIYDRGGRPVIYQPDSDFALLPEQLAWRHVRFDLAGPPIVDFTWEREWRIPCDQLPFSEAEAVIVVPNDQWTAALLRVHDDKQDIEIQQYALVMDRQIAELWREDFRWRVVPLQ